MNALFAILVWFLGIFAAPTAVVDAQDGFAAQQHISTSGEDIINVNPRTVVALEDTHFRPNN